MILYHEIADLLVFKTLDIVFGVFTCNFKFVGGFIVIFGFWYWLFGFGIVCITLFTFFSNGEPFGSIIWSKWLIKF